MPEDSNQPGDTAANLNDTPGAPQDLGEITSEVYRRAGSPGSASDSVSLSRLPLRKKEEKPPEPKDSFREIIETIVFVVVLVFMLKTFFAEAFVIPTGSMANTLFGYHRNVTCQQCRYRFDVNAAKEAEPQDGIRVDVETADCPNCFYRNEVRGVPQGGMP